MERSKGHMFFAQYHRNPEILETVEFYMRDNEVYRAPLSSVVMPDGYRCGRWVCEKSLFDKYEAVIVETYHNIF